MTRSLLVALVSVRLILAAPVPQTWERLEKLNPGAPVEVATSTRIEKGEFVSSSTESLTIRTGQGEHRFPRQEVVRVISRAHSRRMRNLLIGVGVGAAIGLAADQTIGTYLRNESNPTGARALIWTLPIALCGAVAAAVPSYPVIYRK